MHHTLGVDARATDPLWRVDSIERREVGLRERRMEVTVTVDGGWRSDSDQEQIVFKKGGFWALGALGLFWVYLDCVVLDFVDICLIYY